MVESRELRVERLRVAARDSFTFPGDVRVPGGLLGPNAAIRGLRSHELDQPSLLIPRPVNPPPPP